MSAPKNPPKPAPTPDTPPAPPTAAQQQQMGTEAMAGVDPATQTPAQAQAQMAANLNKSDTLRNMGLSDEERAKIAQESAAATISMLEARGAFEPPAAPAPADPARDGLVTPPPEGEPAAPRKRSFAERFMGRE